MIVSPVLDKMTGLLLGLVLLLQEAAGQDDGGDLLDMESMMGGPGSDGPKVTGKAVVIPEYTYIEQTTRALQQLALVIGVAFMVAFLFMVMIGMEKIWDKLEEKYKVAFGKHTQEEEDPAALVGTFKRYKN